MKIQWFGDSTFLLTTSFGKKILLDPFNIFNILKENITADISSFSKPIDFSTLENIKNLGKIINTACNTSSYNIKIKGYECKSDSINGLKRGDNIIYSYEFDDMKICHLGYLGEFINLELIKNLKNYDVLFLPIGDNLCLNGRDSYLLANKLQPKYIIPMCYRNKSSDFYFNGPKEFLSLSKNVLSVRNNFIYLSDFHNATLPATILINNS